MPISVESHNLSSETPARFARVLRDQPAYQAELEAACRTGKGRLFAAHFNGQPVALALLDTDTPSLQWLVVHPATRGRGVGRDLLRLVGRKLGEELHLPQECGSH